MDLLNALTHFVRAAEARSFSVAARQLHMTPSAVSKSVARLERELDARLLVRTTHAITLTEAGQLFLDRAARVVAELAEARDVLDHDRRGARGPRGTLRVDAPLGFGRMVLGPLVPAFLARHAQLRVELSLRDDFVDPVADAVDVLVRVGEPTEASLSVRKLAVGRMVICGAPRYLKRRGVPRKAADLDAHECLPFLRAGRPRPWLLAESHEGTTRPFTPRGRFATDNAELLRDAAVDGAGLICLLDFMVRRDLDAGRLRAVLADQVREERPVYAVQPLHRQTSAKVRAFVDYLVETLSPPRGPRVHGPRRPATIGGT